MIRRLVSLERNTVAPLELSSAQDASHSQTTRRLVRIHVLGSMRATTYLGSNILPRGKKARAVLGYLSLAAGESVPRGRLAAMLWDRVSDAHARTSLRQALRELAAAMGPLASELISADRETIWLDDSLCWIDAAAILAPGTDSPNSSRSDLAALCPGELLEELDGTSASFDQWLLGQRTFFQQQVRELLEAELHQPARPKADLKRRIANARRLIAFDPTHEGASRALMRALADIGERAQALREYVRVRNALRKALDVEPSPETRALCDAIRSFSGSQRTARPHPLPSLPPDSILSADRNVQPVPSTRTRLRVGVLPFLALRSRDEKNLAFSLSQEIAAGLARFRWFDVIAPIWLKRHSASQTSEDLLKCKELDYAVDGVLSRNGKFFHISVRLLDLTQFTRPVWSDRFELPVGELHRLDEQVTASIVGRIDPMILFIEGQPRRRERYGATGLLLLAIPLMYSLERNKFEEAGNLINRAQQIDPDDAMVSAWAAYWQMYHVGQGWSQNPQQTFAMARKHALTAIRLDPENAEALGIYAHVCSFIDKDFDSALHYFDRALRVNPNLAFVWQLSALTYCYIGEPDIGLQRLARHRDLAPIEPYPALFDSPYAVAYMFKGDYEKAAMFGRRVAKTRPEYTNGYKPLIAALGHLGRIDEARLHVDKLLSLEPGFSVERFGLRYPFKHESDRARYMMGLRLAGVPER